jgi:hypothetical protein
LAKAEGPRRRLLDRPAARLLALVVAVAAGWAIWRLPAPGSPTIPIAAVGAAPPAAESCELRRRGEIEALRASGQLSAEMAMRQRQLIAQDCAATR